MKSTLLAVAALAAVAIASVSAFARREGATVYAEGRQGVRCVFFSNTGVAASYEIDYGAPQWKSEYDTDFDAKTLDVVLQRVDARRREMAALAHRAAEHVLEAPGAVDEFFG